MAGAKLSNAPANASLRSHLAFQRLISATRDTTQSHNPNEYHSADRQGGHEDNQDRQQHAFLQTSRLSNADKLARLATHGLKEACSRPAGRRRSKM